MAESRDFRAQFWTKSAVFTAVLLGILVVLSIVGDDLSRFKVDCTEDQLYTLTPASKRILSKLEDRVVVTYYCSEELPSVLVNLRRDTVDMLEEIKRLSDGNVEYKVVNPEKEALYFARDKVEEYEELKENNETPEEPKRRETIQDLFMNRGKQKRSDEDIAKERRQLASAIATKTGRDEDEVYEEQLRSDFKNVYLEDLQEDGIIPLSFTEQRGSNVQEVSFYSGIEVRYQDRPPEVLPYYYELPKLELELATRIVKLTTVDKPKIAFFDARAPDVETPSMNPFSQQPQGPQSDYMQLVQALQEIFDVRIIKLKDGDTVDDFVAKLAEDSEGGRVSCLVVAQPDALEKRQVYEISKAVSSGIPTIFLVSRNSIDLQQKRSELSEIRFYRSGLDDFFRSLGFSLGHDVLASNSCSTLPVLQKLGGFVIPRAHPFAVTVRSTAKDRTLSREIALTNGVSGLVFPATNGLHLHGADLKKAGITATKIAWTHENTWAVQVPPITQNPFGQGAGAPTLIQYQDDLIKMKRPPDQHKRDFIERRELVVLLQGKFPFFFQGQEIPEWEPEPETPAGAPPGGLPYGLPPGLQIPGGPIGGGGPAGPDAVPAPADGTNPADAAATPAGDVAATPPAEEEKAPEPVLADVTPVEGKVLVVASADVLKDRFLLQQSRDYNANVQFFRNALETFGLSEDLLDIRVKEHTQRNFEPGTDESKQFWIQSVNIFFSPFLIGLIGLTRYLVRRGEANAYERQIRGGKK